MLALLDAMGLDEVAFVGHDWGAWTGQLVALRAPERVTRLALCNIAPVWPPSRRLTAALNAWRMSYQVVGVPRLGAAIQRSRLMAKVFEGIPPRDQGPFRDAYREPARAEAGRRFYSTFVTQELGPIAQGRYGGQRLTMPLLVVHGTADPVIRPFLVEDFRLHADDVRIEWVHGAGHFVIDEEPAVVAQHLVAFLA